MIVFALAVISDALDGYLARKLNQISRIGSFLDPIADKLLVVGVLTSLMITGTIEDLNIIPALLIISREIFISGFVCTK